MNSFLNLKKKCSKRKRYKTIKKIIQSILEFKKEFKLTKPQIYNLVVEYRRAHYFNKGNLSESLQVLAYPSEIDRSILKPYGVEQRRGANWYSFTSYGKLLATSLYKIIGEVDEKKNEELFNFYI